jgi:hypothetical protein
MQKRFFLFFMLSFMSYWSFSGQAQSALPRVEAGAFLSYVNLAESAGEGPGGFGARVSYNLNRYFALDADASHYPQNPSGNFGQSLLSAGVKAGIRIERVGIFAKARPGVMHFGGRAFRATHQGSRNYISFDVGGVFELYPNSRVLLRLDISDNIVDFGDDEFNRGFPVAERPGISHNRQLSFGIGFRF